MKEILFAMGTTAFLLTFASPASALTVPTGAINVSVPDVVSATTSHSIMGVGLTGSVSGGAGASTTINSSASTTGFDLVFYDRNIRDETTTSTPAPISPIQVSSRKDLDSYAKQTIKQDEHVDSISTSQSSVSMSYDAHAKLLGFIPMIVSARAEVTSSGEVAVSYPWYSFLLVKDDITLQDELKVAISSALQANPGIPNTGTASSTGFSPRIQALILEEMRQILQTDFNATSSVTPR